MVESDPAAVTRRRRSRNRKQASPPPAAGQSSAVRRREAGAELEHGWRELAGAGTSQVGVDGALRARDVARPSEDELAEAERDVVIVRRHWRPAGG